MSKAIAIVSGGLDSAVLAYMLNEQGINADLLSFDYGQRHRVELSYAKKLAKKLNVSHDIINLADVGRHLTGSALTDNIEVPKGHYAGSNMRVTVVPNRNAIMLSVAFGVAVSRGAEMVAMAIHAGDHYIYPDCRPEFGVAFNDMQQLAVDGFGHPDLHLSTPFVNMTKADIVQIGRGLGVPFEITWSCYKGGKTHCGACGTCIERKEAFKLAEIQDPTIYKE